MNERARIFFRAMLDGMTGAGLFRKLDYPGAPREFIDSRPVEEIIASGEFQATLDRLQREGLWHPPGDQTASRPSK
jgi:hypothetical protein